MDEIDDKTFVREMQILWQHGDTSHRKMLNGIIIDFFVIGDRAEKIINKLKEKM